ncbi:methylenetetrahydrofolate reductase C-terminal domain-containing protein [Pelotalea chapellei]|uniref:Methylenetetrahydrofolate reductase C-terminal domain-containing protein n=1 Tax=Pelotalea chapellei TaxID=44671 RepID=A0ABS5U9A4_9BACT|nr:methylenetetrahydrofolate reductase C-terminal domain-containing protein [Pelotalea chapellei]MBT1072235.1 methylenetetrahydrofolate reductase C-terminal domain-containing protein [Pelotalea chapellei]
MIVSTQKPLENIISALDGGSRVFIIGCAKCATVCKSGGEEEVFRMQEALAEAGKEITGTIVIDETCHMLRTSRDLRSRQEQVNQADFLLVLSCGAGIQSVAEASDTKVVAGTDSKFLGNIRRFGQFEQRCSLCGDCRLNETGGVCPVTVCAKGLLNGPCGGMVDGACEVNGDSPCAWVTIYERLERQERVEQLHGTTPARDFIHEATPGSLKLGR